MSLKHTSFNRSKKIYNLGLQLLGSENVSKIGKFCIPDSEKC